jgi:metal-responsive CopG/Arc/MetJ family transcriptional regulator
MGAKKKGVKMTQLNVRSIPQELLDKAQKIAKEQDRSLSQVIRELLREYVEENKDKLEEQS